MRFIPFSQLLEERFMAYSLLEFQEYFNSPWVSLSLSMRDAVFFNPALFHAAGENWTSHVDRSVKLLQVSPAFGMPTEKIDLLAIIRECWNVQKGKYENEGWSLGVEAAVLAIANGYPFPMDLDRRPPAPESEVTV